MTRFHITCTPVLSVADVGVVETDQARALRDEQETASGSVVYVRHDERFEFTGEVRVDGLFKYRRNLPAGLDHERRQRGCAVDGDSRRIATARSRWKPGLLVIVTRTMQLRGSRSRAIHGHCGCVFCAHADADLGEPARRVPVVRRNAPPNAPVPSQDDGEWLRQRP